MGEKLYYIHVLTIYLHIKASSACKNFLLPNVTPYKHEYETLRSCVVKFCMTKVYPSFRTFPSYFLLGRPVLTSINRVRCTGVHLSHPERSGQQLETLQNKVTFCP